MKIGQFRFNERLIFPIRETNSSLSQQEAQGATEGIHGFQVEVLDYGQEKFLIRSSWIPNIVECWLFPHITQTIHW